MKMDAELRDYERYSRDVKWLLIISGIWPEFDSFYLKSFAYLGAFCEVVITLGLINFCTYHADDVMLIAKCIGISISFFSTFLKICIFMTYREDLLRLNDSLTTSCARDLEDAGDRRRALKHLPYFAKFFYVQTVAVALALVINIMTALRAIVNGKYVHMYPVVFPISMKAGGPIYWVLIVLEVLGALFVWTVTNGVDSVFGLYALQICGQFQILANRFSGLRSTGDYRKHLKDCIERHHSLIRSRTALQRIFGFLTIWLAVTSAIVQCSLIFQAKVEMKSMGPFKVGYFFFYILMKLVQAFSYCWYGNIITEESGRCLDAMYNAHWPGSGDTRFTSDVLIVLSQKPFVINAMGCMLLKMAMFLKILNTSASYFFLLQTLSEADR